MLLSLLMDPSLGDKKVSVWRAGGSGGDAKKKKKDTKKPHWLIAKEHGKRKNGSEKRRSRAEKAEKSEKSDKNAEKTEKTEKTEKMEKAQPPVSKKAKVEDRERTAELRLLGVEQQRDFVVENLKKVAQLTREPPVSAFAETGAAGSFAERVRAACGEKVWQDASGAGAARKTSRVLVLATTGRCVELLGQLRALLGPAAATAKLWARHMDADEQRKHLASHYAGLAVGTPNRVRTLMQDESFTLSNTAMIVFDCQADQKGQTLFSLPDTAPDMWALLAVCVKRMCKGKLRVCFC